VPSFVRFQTKLRDPDTGTPSGIFIVAHALRDSGRITRDEEQWLRTCLAWFKMHLKVPRCLREPQNRRAISWFKGDNRTAIARIWDLVALLKDYGIFIDIVRTRDPGIIVYEDGYQVVAKPRRKRPNTPKAPVLSRYAAKKNR
jgi:hypothetical protein